MAASCRIAIVDYGMGNLRSVEKAFARVGGDTVVTDSAEQIEMAAGVVLPGVGAFPRAMAEIRERGLDASITATVKRGRPLLGICLGVQLLFQRSSELGGSEGLGLLEGEVLPLDAAGLKIPQIAWNAVSWKRESDLTEGLPNPTAFYHVHSFAPVPAHPEDQLGTAEYGSQFTTAVEHGSIFGVQFHPEKSGPDGLKLLSNWLAVCKRVAAGDGDRHVVGRVA